MNNTNTGGPAFPTPLQHDDWREDYPGMTLRDYFAAKAMQSLTSELGQECYRDVIQTHIAGLSYQMADAMMKAREQ